MESDQVEWWGYYLPQCGRNRCSAQIFFCSNRLFVKSIKEIKMYNFGTKSQRRELLEEVFDGHSDYEEQSVYEQDVLDSSDYQTDDFDEEDMQDTVKNQRALASRKREVLYGASLADDAVNLDSLENFWDLLFNQEIIEEIVDSTNKKIEEVSASLLVEERDQTYHHHTDPLEIRAYIGILYYAGLWKSSKVDNNELWDKTNGVDFYRAVFSRMRFEFLQSCLRFDARENRDPDDRFSPIRKVWYIFINNCTKYYNRSNKCTVDEQLLGFRGRCAFRMYIKSKPDKYGIKLITLNDASTAYLIHAIPYLGKDATIDNPQKLPSGKYFFQAVTTPIHGSNRTVTCDNWFTTIPLLTRMLHQLFNMSLTGTIRKNKREIPMEMTLASKNPPETKFCHTKDITLPSYTPKKNQIVLVGSTYLHTQEITDGKPNTILHYNDTKGGTDTFDQLCHAYSVARRTNRWPMRIFFGMLVQAAVNSRILLAGTFLRKELRMVITSILKIDNNQKMSDMEKVTFDQGRRCLLCNRKRDKKTRVGCSACRRPVCEEHRFTLCDNCLNSRIFQNVCG
ncbi:piggyBac transposable element-derived protein 4-like [Prorops nasuta]|uniref:piggyBac transposable element-derived protein 4-like n=1 Tax=Prorops nasuta TaxID=863751 RepID=UPI0034CD4E14